MDEYSGHADGPELQQWIAARHPIRKGLFLCHGEERALEGLRRSLADRGLPDFRILVPVLDEAYELTADAPELVPSVRQRRLAPEAVVHLDWHNDMSKFILDLNEKIEAAADERARRLIIRRLRRALEADS